MLDERRIEFGGEASTHWKTSRGHKAFSGAFPKKRNLCYSLLLAVNEDQLHVATRLSYPDASVLHG